MNTKLNRDEILKEILQTLVRGWGHAAVLASLHEIRSPLADRKSTRSYKENKKADKAAAQIVADASLPAEKKHLLLQLAERFDEGSAFPRITDVRSFLITHDRNSNDIKDRSQAFKRMLPVLSGMSEKGLEKVISRSHHSGPAELEAISNAIRGAGEDLRGVRNSERALRREEETDGDGSS